MSFKFNMDDRVKVVDDGQLYDTYSFYGNEYVGWERGRHPKRKTKYRVIGQHGDGSGSNIYAIENASGQVYLYGEDGLCRIMPAKPTLAPEPEAFNFPDWIEIKPYDGVNKTGLIIDKRKFGNSNQAACWLSKDRNSWACNSSFRSNLNPAEAAMMLLALEEVHENSPC